MIYAVLREVTSGVLSPILGNNALHLLTSNRNYKLRIELEDFDGDKRFAEYAQFTVGSATDNYRLNISGYSGTAGMYPFMYIIVTF